MDQILDAIVAFVSAHRAWAGYLAFVFALCETIAFISILIPSTAILIGVGALVATGGLDFTPIWVGGALGALAGSNLSYWLGWRYGGRLLALPPLNRYPEFVDSGTAAFARWGAVTVLIGHFFGPLRSVVFLMSGMARMPLWQFQGFNLLGAVAWAWAIPKSGELGGSALGHVWSLLSGG